MSVYVVRRTTRAGEPRWLVRWQRGRYARQVHLGSFRTRREADARAEWARMKIAAGVAPTLDELARDLDQAPAPPTSVADAVDAWIASRVDVAESTRQTYRSLALRIVADLGGEDAATITAERIARWVREVGVAPGSVPKYLGALAMVLDHAGRDPNPARARVVRAPRAERAAMRLPSRAEVALVRAQLAARFRVAFDLLEHTGARVSEACAVTWGDVDAERARVLVRGTKTSSAARWVPLDVFGGLVLDRPAGALDSQRVAGCGPDAIAAAINRACVRADVQPPFSPHDLRHLWVTRRVWRGDPLPLVSAEAGHASVAFTLSRYAAQNLPADWR